MGRRRCRRTHDSSVSLSVPRIEDYVEANELVQGLDESTLRYMAPKNKENNKRKKQMEDEGDEDYRKRRDRNNQAVKRSRVKSKLRTQQTLERVTQLKTENELLEEKIKMLTKELGFLKNLFIAHSGLPSHTTEAVNIQDLDLTALLADENATEASLKTGSAKL